VLHQQITKPATPAQIAQRSFRVAHVPQPDWSLRRGMDWTLKLYGEGADWTRRHGSESLHSSEEAARAYGERWNVAGRGPEYGAAL
jgi:hypothetical protein